MDGTIIGNITPQICEWNMISSYARPKMAQFKKSLETQLNNGLIRPGFVTYLDYLKLQHDCEIFMYTASEHKWAHFIIPCIEKAIGTQFHKPYLTRNHCTLLSNGYIKSLSEILPIIYSNLSKEKYKGLELADLKNQIVLIDNNRVLENHEDSKLIFCPTYKYTDVYDVLRLLTEDTLIRNYLQIAEILETFGLFPNTETKHFSFHTFKALYYSTLADVTKNCIKFTVKDEFWPKLGKIMSAIKYSDMNDSVIKNINLRLK